MTTEVAWAIWCLTYIWSYGDYGDHEVGYTELGGPFTAMASEAMPWYRATCLN